MEESSAPKKDESIFRMTVYDVVGYLSLDEEKIIDRQAKERCIPSIKTPDTKVVSL